MPTLIDSSLWIAFTRLRSPRRLKEFISPYILDPEAHLAEPVIFEVLRHATPAEAKQLKQQFDTLPRLATPAELWDDAAELGRDCRQRNFTAHSLDLLIATIAIHHDAEVVTFDGDFANIASASRLRASVLKPPAP
jgi:predicted nucleic acid-binding protein